MFIKTTKDKAATRRISYDNMRVIETRNHTYVVWFLNGVVVRKLKLS